MIDLLQDLDFVFWVPLEIEKSTKTEEKSIKRIIQGVASTPDKDLQDEFVDQSGIDFSYFLKFGYYNNDHKPGFENKVGQPSVARVERAGLWTKGFLFKNHKIADAIWELALALEASQSDRKLGFSIQGKVLKRSLNKILKCWVQDIAITTAPINTNTWLDVVKSLNSIPSEYWVLNESCNISPRLISPIAKSTCANCQKNLSEKLQEHSIDESKMDLKKTSCEQCGKSTCVCESKSLTTSAPIKVQSLEGDVKDQQWGRTFDAKKSVESLYDRPLTLEECVKVLSEHRQLTRPDARVVAEVIFEMNGLN